MKKKWILTAGLILVLSVFAAVVAIHFWFESAGVQVLGNDIHAELSGKCYIIDPETKEIKDETTLYINGSSSYSDSSLFEGELTVVGYQNTASGTITATMAVERGENGFWLIHHLETCTHQETEDGITKPKEHFCDYQYIYYLNTERDGQVVVRIESSGEDPLYAVRADSQEQALEYYQVFSDHHP